MANLFRLFFRRFRRLCTLTKPRHFSLGSYDILPPTFALHTYRFTVMLPVYLERMRFRNVFKPTSCRIVFVTRSMRVPPSKLMSEGVRTLRPFLNE